MDRKEFVQVTIVNANYPPNPGITGFSAHALAIYLKGQGVSVSIVHTDQVYSGKLSMPVESEHRYQVKSSYAGKSKLIRLIASFHDSYRLIRKARSVSPDGWVLVMTDPPFLGFWAAILLKKTRWVLWTMDLYPQAFAAAGLVSTNNIFYRLFRQLILANPPLAMINLGVNQRDHLLEEYNRPLPSIILPCGIHQEICSAIKPYWKQEERKIYIGYCGNVGEAHDVDFLLHSLEAFDPSRMVFVLSIYGIKAPAVLLKAASLPGVVLVDHVPRNELCYIDLQLVSLKPEWDNICVPSKAFSAVCSGSLILFYGSGKNDITAYLKSAGYFLEPSSTLRNDLAIFFEGLTIEKLAQKKNQIQSVRQALLQGERDAYQKVLQYFQQTEDAS